MDWNKLYKQWQSEKIDEQPMFNKSLIKKFNNMNEYNRELYVEYHNYFLKESDRNPTSYKTYRSKLINFLTNENIRQKKLYELTQIDLDNYFAEYMLEDKQSTFNSRVGYIKDFVKIHKDKLIIELDFDKYLTTKNEIEEDMDNVAVPLNSEEIELYREIYYSQPIKLFLFEMIYYTNISLKDLRLLNYNLYNKKEGAFILKNGKEFKVPTQLSPLVERLKDESFFNSNKNYILLINEIKKDLRDNGILENFKYSNITKTTEESAFINCPECNEKFEAIVDNWCAKQYYEGGNNWIVCRRCGGLNE